MLKEEDNSPIIVSGPPRSGTTFMQFFLCNHPNIHIHGQEPNLPWNVTFGWLDKMIKAGKWGKKSNVSTDVRGYPFPHYAGSNEERCELVFRRMMKDFLCGFGPETPRWGGKFLWLCTKKGMAHRIESLWPGTKWIICIRHPFTSFESQKNTFVRDMNLDVWINRWISSVEFLDSHKGKAMCVQVDRLNDRRSRKARLNKVLRFIGESPTEETDLFIDNWEVVHKVKKDKDRKFTLGDKRKKDMFDKFDQLLPCMKKLGYR